MSDTKSNVRVRFAPSPTGYLHVGGARTLLFNWLYARKMGGTLVLRIEDTDQARSTREHEKMIYEDVRSLDLGADEGTEIPASVGPYRQSERMEIYAKLAKQLLDEDKVYYCFCPEALLTEKRQAALKMGKAPHYDGTCLRLSKDQVKVKFESGEKAGLRFKAYQKLYVLNDVVRGKVEFKPGIVGDFFITRTPTANEQEIIQGIGMPVYNFCCVIDDHLMNMTHVIRAEEHLSNTSRQLMIFDAFGWTPPTFVHIAIVLGADRQKLSKRSGDVSVHEYLEKGYLPEALLNFLALIGWWPKGDYKTKSGHPEIFDRAELMELFDLGGLQKAAGIFDLQKLNWMNGQYIKALPISELAKRARPFFEAAGLDFSKHNASWLEGILDSVKNDATTLASLPIASKFYFDEAPEVEAEAHAIAKEPDSIKVMGVLREEFNLLPEALEPAHIDQLQKTVGLKTGVKGKGLFMPIRIAITGKTHGPELKKVLPILGKAKVLSRMESIQKQLGY